MKDAEAEALLFERELEIEARETQRLSDLLVEEQRVLTGRDHELLLGIAAEKSQHIAALERLAERRTAFLRRNGLHPGREGMLDWLTTHPERETAARAWLRIQELAGSAREANEINGGLLSLELQRLQRRLAFLHAHASNDPTYTPDGYTQTSPPWRSLGEA